MWAGERVKEMKIKHAGRYPEYRIWGHSKSGGENFVPKINEMENIEHLKHLHHMKIKKYEQ